MDLLGLKIERLNRMSYFLSVLISMFIFVAAGSLVGGILEAMFGNGAADSPWFGFGLIPFMIAWYAYYVLLTVKRFHDLNMSGWWTLSTFTPYLGVVILLLLIIKSGDKHENKYGARPFSLAIMGLRINRTA